MSDDHFYKAWEIQAFAAQQKCTVEEFRQRWVIVNNGACFIHGAHGYRAPIRNQLDLSIALKKWLAPVPGPAVSPAGIEWEIPLGQGTKEKSSERIIVEYGQIATSHILSTSIERSYYDPATETFYERVCPMRKLEPAFDEQVDHWLRLLGGAQADTLLDWLATSTDLSRPSPAIYIHARKDSGKNMLAMGLARVWGHMPTPLDSALSSFNSALLNCPVVFADEEMPRGVTSGTVRALVSALSHSIRRKGRDEGSLLGALRIVIVANNDGVLKFDREDLEREDVEAVAARILYFKCDPSAAAYLQSLGGFAGTTDWVTGDRIARHVRWLAENRVVARGARFLIEGGVDVAHRNLATSGRERERAIEWICRAILEPWTVQNPGIRFGGGELYVNAGFVQQNWEGLLKTPITPSLAAISRWFRPLTRGDDKRLRIGPPRDKNKTRRADFYRIDPRFVYDCVTKLQLGTVEEFQELIDRGRAAEDDDGGGTTPINGGGVVIPLNGNYTSHQATNGATSHGPLSDLADASEIDFFNPPLTGRSLFDDLQ